MISRFIPALTVLTILSASSARAEDGVLVSDIVVTASRVPVPADQSGSAVSVIDGKTLQERQIITVFDALREVPGVAVSRSGDLGSLSQIRIRGAEANQTLVLVDGVEANDPAASDEFNFAHLFSAGIARVEILRGPQSALWGADALAGVVNIITLAPQEGFYGSGRAEAGSFNTREVSGVFNAGTADYGGVLDAAYVKSDGINIALTGHEKDGYENTSIGGRGFVRLSPVLVFSVSLHHVNGNSDFDSGFPLPVDSADFTEAAFTYGRAEAKATFLGGTLELIAGASLTRTRSDNFASTTFDFSNIAFSDGIGGGKTKYDLQTNIFWSGFGFDQRLSALAETKYESFTQRVVGFPAADQSQHLASSGFAAEYGLGIPDTLFLSLGGRHDWNGPFADSTTWRVSASLPMPDLGLRLHASAGTGVKNPDFFELFGFVPSSFVGNPNLKPERSLGFDAGVEEYFLDRALRLDVTYYHADLENEIFTDFSVFPYTARNMPGRSERQGVEVTAAADLGNGLTFSGAYTYTESAAANGAEELRRPHNIASLDADYRFGDGRAFLNLGIDVHGSQRDTDFVTFQTITLRSYSLVRISGSYRLNDRIALTARIENALDQHYQEVFGFRTPGFAVFTGVSAAFGG